MTRTSHVFTIITLRILETIANVLNFMPKTGEPANTINVSSIPWVNFTGFNLNIYNDATYLIPIFTLGKYFQQDNKILLPMSVQVHHAVCDGYHTSRFFNEAQELASNYETWLGEK